MSDDCLVCSIIAGDVPADVVLRTGTVLAFRDISPQAPTHVLVVPVRHVPNVVALHDAAPAEVADLVAAIGAVAEQEGLTQGGYRTVFNTGAQAQQSLFHAHAHVLGGRDMTWPPG